jgi:hypothetical protein
MSTRDIKFDETKRYSNKDKSIEILEAEEIIRVIKILSLDLYNEKDLVLEDYELSIDTPGDIIIIQDKTILPTTKYNIMSRYRLIRPIDALIIQLLSSEVIPEPEETTNNTILPTVDLIILTHRLNFG